ncbi:MAG: tyrosine-type recombinase/integrase, partial [Pirellula sp.]
MASITTANSGSKRALFYDETKTRRTVYLGRVSDKEAETIRRRIEGILSSKILGSPMAQDDAAWLAKSPALREKLIAVGLVEPEPIPEKVIIPTLDAFLNGYIKRHGKSRKPATVAVWKQVVANLKEYMPEGIRINQITAGHAKEFHEKLKARGMATTTIHKRIQFARQFTHDAVDWKIIEENPFLTVKTQNSSVKVNEFVPREVVDKLMKKANPVWQVILGLSRYGGLRTPSETLSLRW